MQRDEYRVTMDINSFDYVITNNSSLYALMQSVITTSLQITNYSLEKQESSKLSEYIKAALKDN